MPTKQSRALGKNGMERVDVLCPGFAADCLETLEETAMQNRDIFREAGGGDLHYIPALECARRSRVVPRQDWLRSTAGGWPESSPDWSDSEAATGARSLPGARIGGGSNKLSGIGRFLEISVQAGDVPESLSFL